MSAYTVFYMGIPSDGRVDPRVSVRARVCVCVSAVQGPGERQNKQAGWVMVECGDAGRQFNDTPHP